MQDVEMLTVSNLRTFGQSPARGRRRGTRRGRRDGGEDAQPGRGGHRRGAAKDRIEFFNFAIEFSDHFRNFHQNFSEFSKFSAILTEFGYFGARSRNSDKISSQFRREIAVFLRKL